MLRTPSIFILALAALLLGCPGSKNPDAGTGGGIGGGAGGGNDAGTDGGQDAGPPGLTCNGLLLCDQVCNGNACTDGCYAKSTAVAQGLFNAFDDCINDNCSSMDGGPCVDSSSSACSTCNEQAATGPCISRLAGCEDDMVVGPPNPDGGVIVPDAGSVLNCGQLISCLSTCPEDGGACVTDCNQQATAEAIALDVALNQCLEQFCPSTDGGPCTSQGVECNGCVEQVEFGNGCGVPYTSCVHDMSDTDGGSVPTVLNGGVLTLLLSGDDLIGSPLLSHDGFLYYGQESSDYVSRYSIADGGTTRLEPMQHTPVGMTVDSNNLYVWNYGTFPNGAQISNKDGVVMQIPLDGGPAITLSSTTEVFYSAPYLNAIAVDSTYAYWVTGTNANDGAIMKTALGNPDASVLYAGQALPEAIVTDGVNLYWSTWGTFDSLGNSNNDGKIMQAPADGGAMITLASGVSAPGCMAIDDTNVYWTELGRLGGNNLPAFNSGAVKRVPKGGGAVKVIASPQSVPVAILVANGIVYWTEYGLSSPGLVLSEAVDGGSVVPLVAGLQDPYGLAISGSTLYFSFYSAVPSGNNAPLIMSVTLP